MLNYFKSEVYRALRSRELYLLTGIACAIVLLGNTLLFTVGTTDSTFPYNTVWFSLSNLIAMLTFLFLGGFLVVALLFADDKKNGLFKNAVAHGLSRSKLFIGKILIGVVLGLVCMAIILAVYIGSAVLLLNGPAIEPIRYLLEGVAATLPSVIAVIILGVACFALLNNTTSAMIVWVAIVLAVPIALSVIGQRFDLIASIASWIPTNFLTQEVEILRSGQTDFLWRDSFGLMKCLVAGFGSIAVFLGLGLWRARKVEV